MTQQLASLTSANLFADSALDLSERRTSGSQDVLDAALEELAYRENNGIEITLFWDRTGGSFSVFVVDTRRDERFELDVAGHEAMEVFHHPYAYAAFRGVEPRTFGIEAEIVEPQIV
jgi:hypothetical protein